jgi:ParB family transcriptional regulator, chromosome partitioning protein
MKYVDVDCIRPNPYQPRTEFDPAAIESLRASISKHGVLEPLLLREVEGAYEIIAGERRYRASVKAGLKEVPALIRKTTDSEMLELAIIENLHREDISPIDKARGFKRMIEEFGFTQKQISQVTGVSRPAIANTIRLLDLPKQIQKALHKKEISEGHARAILLIKDHEARELALKRIVNGKFTVREAEELSKVINKSRRKVKLLESCGFERDLISELQERLGTKVHVIRRGKSGKIEIEFYDEEDLQRIAETLHI